MNASDLDKWVSAYIAAQEDPDVVKPGHPHWWAVDRFMEIIEHDPETVWVAILAIFARGPNEGVLGMLAAGPLEDLIHFHGPAFIDRIEIEARTDAHFRHMLGGVWKGGAPDVWQRVEAVRGEPW